MAGEADWAVMDIGIYSLETKAVKRLHSLNSEKL